MASHHVSASLFPEAAVSMQGCETRSGQLLREQLLAIQLKGCSGRLFGQLECREKGINLIHDTLSSRLGFGSRQFEWSGRTSNELGAPVSPYQRLIKHILFWI